MSSSGTAGCRRPRRLARIAWAGLAGLVFSGLAASAQAAIPEPYERIREFNDILFAGNEAASKLLKYGMVDRIERLEDGSFRFWAKGCFVPVRREAVPQQHPLPPGGRGQYRVISGDARCQ